jgi:hypothetical protein
MSVTVTAALAIAAPWGSVTVPKMVPVVTCPKDIVGTRERIMIVTAHHTHRFFILSSTQLGRCMQRQPPMRLLHLRQLLLPLC